MPWTPEVAVETTTLETLYCLFPITRQVYAPSQTTHDGNGGICAGLCLGASTGSPGSSGRWRLLCHFQLRLPLLLGRLVSSALLALLGILRTATVLLRSTARLLCLAARAILRSGQSLSLSSGWPNSMGYANTLLLTVATRGSRHACSGRSWPASAACAHRRCRLDRYARIIEARATGDMCLDYGMLEVECDENALDHGPTGGWSVPSGPSTENRHRVAERLPSRLKLAVIQGMSD